MSHADSGSSSASDDFYSSGCVMVKKKYEVPNLLPATSSRLRRTKRQKEKLAHLQLTPLRGSVIPEQGQG